MPKFEKQGVITSEAIENQLYSEPDGSKWVQIVHHNNPADVRFASTNDFTKYLYIDKDRWFKAHLCNLVTNNHYEFLIIQSETSDVYSSVKYRWTQSINPYNAVFDDVDAADVTYNSGSGYTVPSGWGGMHKVNANTFFCANNGTASNWWGAVGAWNSHQGGIPAWGGMVVTTGFQNVYLRVDGVLTEEDFKKLSIFPNEIVTKDYYEI